MKKVILFIVLVVLVISGVKLIKNKSSELANAPMAQQPIFSVNVLNAKEQTLKQTDSFLAKLESQNAPMITTKISGFIKTLHVKENQVIKKGDLLVEIDSQEVQESLKQIQNSIKSMDYAIQSIEVNILSLSSDLKASKSKLDRNVILFNAGGLAKQIYESSQVEYESKKAKLDSTLKSIEAKKYELDAMKNSYGVKKASLEYYNIKAPIDAIVDTVILREGDMAIAGKTILTIQDKKQKLTFTFASSDIKEGLEVSINETTKSKISKVLQSTDKYLQVAQIDLDTPLDLPVGSFVNIEVTTKTVTDLALPINTILHKSDGTYVVIYENNTFAFKKVEILAQDENYIVISEDIKQKVALASESKLAILPSSNNYTIVEK